MGSLATLARHCGRILIPVISRFRRDAAQRVPAAPVDAVPRDVEACDLARTDRRPDMTQHRSVIVVAKIDDDAALLQPAVLSVRGDGGAGRMQDRREQQNDHREQGGGDITPSEHPFRQMRSAAVVGGPWAPSS